MFLDGIELSKEYIEEHIEEIRKTVARYLKEGNLEEVKRIQTLIHRADTKNARSILDLIKIAKKENDIEAVVRLQKENFELHQNRILEIEELIVKAQEEGNTDTLRELMQKKQKHIAKSLISLYDLAGIAWRRQDFDEVERIMREILEINPDDERTKSNLEHVTDIKSRRRSRDKQPKQEVKESRGKLSIHKMREKLHMGEITEEQIQQIEEEYKNSLQWVIFLTEYYMYSKQPSKARRILEEYENSHPNMSKKEIILWERAMEIKKIFDLGKWDAVYSGSNNGNQDGR